MDLRIVTILTRSLAIGRGERKREEAAVGNYLEFAIIKRIRYFPGCLL